MVIMSLPATALAGALGMAVDFGRMYITKNELQVFCDAASLAAAVKLDGTTSGLSNATYAVSSSVNGWNFGTTLAVFSLSLGFAASSR